MRQKLTNLYVSTTFCTDGSKVTDVVDACFKAGLDYLELGSNHCYETNLIKNKLFRRGSLLVHNYFPPSEIPFVINLASSDDAIRQRSQQQIFAALEFCQSIGARLYTFHPGFLMDPSGPGRSSKNYDFQWRDEVLKANEKEQKAGFDRMLNGVEIVIRRAAELGVRVAIETEGSYRKPGHLLMQQPEEYSIFFSKFDFEDIGINLNLGHLPLAAKVFDFSWQSFVDLMAPRIVAMELSHNDGIDDQHLILKEEGWYWDLILDSRFEEVPKILEVRDTSIKDTIDCLDMIKNKTNGV